MMKKLCSLLLALVMVVTLLPGGLWQPAMAEDISGQFGDNLTWTLDDAGTLTISGSGRIPDFDANTRAPWYNRRNEIYYVIIETGITAIGQYAFQDSYMKSVSIPDTVTEIRTDAFADCMSLVEITIPASVSIIGGNVFENCNHLRAVNVAAANQYYASLDGVVYNIDKTLLVYYPSGRQAPLFEIPESVTKISEFAFCTPTYLERIDIPSTVNSVSPYAFNCCYCPIVFRGEAPDYIDANAFAGSVTTVYYPSNNQTWENVRNQLYGAKSLPWVDLSQLPELRLHTTHEWKFYTICVRASLTKDPSCICEGGECRLSFANHGFRVAFSSPHEASVYLFTTEDNMQLEFSYPMTDRYARLEDLGDGCYKLTLTANGDGWGAQVDGETVYNTSFNVPILVKGDFGDLVIGVEFVSTAAHSYRGIAVSASKTPDPSCTKDCGLIRVTQDTNGECLVDTGFEVNYNPCATSTDLESPYVYLTTDGKTLSLYQGYDAFASLEHVEGYTYKLTLTKPRAPGDYTDDRWGDGTYIAIARSGSDETAWDPFRVWFTPFYTWTEDEITATLQNGTLTISGSGGIPDYFRWEGQHAPWYDNRYEIQHVEIESGITAIGTSAFQDCLFMKSVTIPNTVEVIGGAAFSNCGTLTEITIPASVRSMDALTFEYCASLRAFRVDENNQSYSSFDGVLFDKEMKTLLWYPNDRPDYSYTVPQEVEEISKFAFYLPKHLERIIMGDNVKRVGYRAINSRSFDIVFQGNAPTFDEEAFKWSDTTVYYPSNNPTWSEVAAQPFGAFSLTWEDLSKLPKLAVHAQHEWKYFNVYLGASLAEDPSCTCDGGDCRLSVTDNGFRVEFASPYEASVYLFKPSDGHGLSFADSSVNNYARLEDLGDGLYRLTLAAHGDYWGTQVDGKSVYSTSFDVPIQISYNDGYRGVNVTFASTAAHTYRGIAVSASKTEDVRCTDGCGIGEVTFDTNGENLVDTGFVATYTDLQEAYVYLTTDGKKLSLYKGYEQFARLEHVSGYTYKLTLVQPREYGVYQDDRWGDGTYIAIARTAEGEDTWDPFRVWFTPAQHSHSWGDDHRCTVCGITDPAAKLKDLVANNSGAVQAESGCEQELANAIENGTVHAEVETVPSQGEAEDFNLAEGETFLRCWNTMFHLFDGNGIRKLGQLLELEHAYMVEYEIGESEYEWLSHHWNITIVRRHYDANGVCTVERLGMPQIGCMETGAGKRYFVQFASDRFSDFALVVGKEMTGDINCDEAINITDLQALFTYLSTGKAENAKLQAQPDTLLQAADVTGDGVVNILDYQALYETVQTG